MKYPVDVRLADFLRRCFKYYINKRIPKNIIVPPPSEEEVWQANFITGNDSIEFNLSENVKITLFRDSQLSKLIYFSFEETEINFMKRFLKSGDIFFDVGSNIGLFSLHASSIIGEFGKVYSFEPTPEIFKRFQKNINLNNFSNIVPENIGLSNSVGSLNFHIANNGFDALNSVVQLSELGEGFTIINVNTTTIDEYIQSNKIKEVNLIKIDVEGWELNVLKGASSLLQSESPPVFLVEFTENNAFTAGYYLGELYDYLKGFGYQWYSYDDLGNRLNPEAKKLHYLYENLVAIKNLNPVISRLNS